MHNILKIILSVVSVLLMAQTEKVYGNEIFDFSDAQEIMDEYSDSGFSIKDTVDSMKEGDSTGFIMDILTSLKGYLMDEITYNKKAIVIIIFIAVGGALLTNFASALGSADVSETGSMMSYILMTGYLLTGFSMVLSVAKDAVEGVTGFLTALIPSYFISVGLSGAGTSAVGFYELALIALSVISNVLTKFMLPAVMIFVVILVINSINTKDYLSKFAELIKMAVLWGLKIMTGLVIGINVIQSMILPSVDAMEGKTVTKVIRLIPGIGGGAESVADLIIGSGALIKNAIGTTIVAGMAIICSIPAIKIAVYIFMYKIAGAILQPVSDKNMNDCMEAVIEGGKLLLKITVYAFALFSVSIAIICMATNIKY